MLLVVCAIIIDQDEILICQRSEKMKLPLKWEFPGGKVEKNEFYQDSLKREIYEELGIRILPIKELTSVEYDYDDFSIKLIPFICQLETKEIILAEHKDYKWISINEFDNFDFAEADKPIIQELLQIWNLEFTKR